MNYHYSAIIIINGPRAVHPVNCRVKLNGWYCGDGRFCETEEEAREWLKAKGIDDITVLK